MGLRKHQKAERYRQHDYGDKLYPAGNFERQNLIFLMHPVREIDVDALFERILAIVHGTTCTRP